MLAFLLWCLLFVLCWPLALFALIMYPIVWLFLLPFRLARDCCARRTRAGLGRCDAAGAAVERSIPTRAGRLGLDAKNTVPSDDSPRGRLQPIPAWL